MTVPLSARQDELREVLAEWLWEAQPNPMPWATISDFSRDGFRRLADALLSGPLAPLLATVRDLSDAIDKARALADELDRELDDYGYAVRNGLKPGPGDRLRALLPAAPIDYSQHVGSCRVFYAERRCTCVGKQPAPDHEQPTDEEPDRG